MRGGAPSTLTLVTCLSNLSGLRAWHRCHDRYVGEAIALGGVAIESLLVLGGGKAVARGPGPVTRGRRLIPDSGVARGTADVVSVDVLRSVALGDVAVKGGLVLGRRKPVARYLRVGYALLL